MKGEGSLEGNGEETQGRTLLLHTVPPCYKEASVAVLSAHVTCNPDIGLLSAHGIPQNQSFEAQCSSSRTPLLTSTFWNRGARELRSRTEDSVDCNILEQRRQERPTFQNKGGGRSDCELTGCPPSGSVGRWTCSGSVSSRTPLWAAWAAWVAALILGRVRASPWSLREWSFS